MIRIKPEVFKKRLQAALKKGEEGLDEAVDLYLWARKNIKAMHRVDPGYTQESTITAIRRVWNIDPQDYLRAACRLGGGTEQKHADLGRAMIKRFGVFECVERAEKILGVDQMKKLPALVAKLSKDAGPDEFRKIVDELYKKELASIRRGNGGKGKRGARVGWKQECEALKKRVIELEARLEEKDGLVKQLRGEIRWLKRQISAAPKASRKRAAS